MKRHIILSSFKATCLTVGCLMAACAYTQEAPGQDTQPIQEGKSATASDLQVESVPTVTGEAAAESKKAENKISLGPGLQRLADMAMQDLGSILGLEQEAIEVVQANYVTWRDSSLGCPQPGYEYMQVLTNGSRIRLRGDKQVYQYHSGGNRAPFLCKTPSKTEPLPYAAGET
jgi:hypothetical protein